MAIEFPVTTNCSDVAQLSDEDLVHQVAIDVGMAATGLYPRDITDWEPRSDILDAIGFMLDPVGNERRNMARTEKLFTDVERIARIGRLREFFSRMTLNMDFEMSPEPGDGNG